MTITMTSRITSPTIKPTGTESPEQQQ